VNEQVPAQFIAQYPSHANPPTLTMAITALIRRFQATSLSNFDLGIGYVQQVPVSVPGSRYSEGADPTIQSPALARESLLRLYPKLKTHYEWFRRTQRGQIKIYGRKARSRTEAYRWRGRSSTHVLTSGMDDYPRGPPHAGELHLDLICWMGFFARTMKDIAGFVGYSEDELEFARTESDIIANIDGASTLTSFV
jgi:mannosyl-oligosaccharide glucosidase